MSRKINGLLKMPHVLMFALFFIVFTFIFVWYFSNCKVSYYAAILIILIRFIYIHHKSSLYPKLYFRENYIPK